MGDECSQWADGKTQGKTGKTIFLTSLRIKGWNSIILHIIPLKVNFDFICLADFINNLIQMCTHLMENAHTHTHSLIQVYMLQHIPMFVKHLFNITVVCDFLICTFHEHSRNPSGTNKMGVMFTGLALINIYPSGRKVYTHWHTHKHRGKENNVI